MRYEIAIALIAFVVATILAMLLAPAFQLLNILIDNFEALFRASENTPQYFPRF